MIDLRKEARGRVCMIRLPRVCNMNPETTVLCHENGAGMALKADDTQAAWGCSSCHNEVDRRTQKLHPRTVAAHFKNAILQTQKILKQEGKIK